jgi:hypothetical protein
MRIYIAGKMRGVEFYNYPAFHEAEQHLKDLGYDVVSPARLDTEAGFLMSHLPDDHDWSEMPPGMDYEETMRRDLAALDTCDAIYMLRGWTTSQGARREQLHAATGPHDFYEQDVLEPPSLVCDEEVEWPDAESKPTGSLPTDSRERKDMPIYSGLLMYFPLACAEVARLSKAANEKHNPGEPMRWSREKSSDHRDCAARHLIESGIEDEDGFLHDAHLAWRAMANLQLALEGNK